VWKGNSSSRSNNASGQYQRVALFYYFGSKITNSSTGFFPFPRFCPRDVG
jgi:hypothetical protein